MHHVSIYIDKQGGIYFNETPVSVEQLKAAVQANKNTEKSNSYVVRADTAASYGFVVETMDLLKSEGADKISVATLKK